jgi:hypothetical protein
MQDKYSGENFSPVEVVNCGKLDKTFTTGAAISGKRKIYSILHTTLYLTT